VSDERLTDQLAERGMGWRLAPGRYLSSGRSWISLSRFRPLVDVRDAFRLLDTVTDDYSLRAIPGGVFTAQVRLAGRIGKASGEPKARVISLAVARAIGLDVENSDTDLRAVTTERARRGNHAE
jgi:hypothetical protein